jgi:hypothetical protein
MKIEGTDIESTDIEVTDKKIGFLAKMLKRHPKK